MIYKVNIKRESKRGEAAMCHCEGAVVTEAILEREIIEARLLRLRLAMTNYRV